MEKQSIGQWRRELIPPLSGQILEIGAGTGVNVAYYSSSARSITLVEPDPDMRSRLERKISGTSKDLRVVTAAAEKLPFPNGSFDVVVATLVLCSVSQPEKSLQEIHRVLTPGGKLVIIEHVRETENVAVIRWQKWLTPIWKRCAGNCHLTRDTLESLHNAGFNCTQITKDFLKGKFARIAPVIRGIAEKA